MQEYNTIVHFLVLLVDIWHWYFISTFWSYLICYHWDRKMYMTAETYDIMEVFGKCQDLESDIVSQIGRWTRKVLNVYISQPALSWGENTFFKNQTKIQNITWTWWYSFVFWRSRDEGHAEQQRSSLQAQQDGAEDEQGHFLMCGTPVCHVPCWRCRYEQLTKICFPNGG